MRAIIGGASRLSSQVESVSDSLTPLPRLGDPDFVLENAAFHALSYPPNRMILRILAAENLSLGEVHGRVHEAIKRVEELRTVGLLSEGSTRARTLRVGGPGLELVRNWLSQLP